MHSILTQSLLPAKGAGPHPASAGEIENAKPPTDRKAQPEQKDQSFIAIFTGLSTVPSDEKVKASPIVPTDTEGALEADVAEGQPIPSETEKPQKSESPAVQKAEFATVGRNELTLQEAKSVGNGELQVTPPRPAGVQVPAGAKQTVEPPVAIAKISTKPLQRHNMLSEKASVDTHVELSQKPSRMITSQVAQHAVQGEKSASDLPPPLSPRGSASDQSSLAELPRSTAPHTPAAPQKSAAQNALTYPVATLAASQPHALQPIPAPDRAMPIPPTTVTTAPVAPLTVQLLNTVLPLADKTSRKAPADRIATSDIAIQTVLSVKQAAPVAPAVKNVPTPAAQSLSLPLSALDPGKATTSLIDAEPLYSMRADISSASSLQHPQSLPPTAPIAQYVARQIAEALQTMPNRPVEISLNPEELGRVRLALSSSEAGIVVNVLAERQETVDLLRRHISHLESAFQDIGYNDIAFSFSGGGQQQEETDGEAHSSAGSKGSVTSDESVVATAQIALNASLEAGLDIRL